MVYGGCLILYCGDVINHPFPSNSAFRPFGNHLPTISWGNPVTPVCFLQMFSTRISKKSNENLRLGHSLQVNDLGHWEACHRYFRWPAQFSGTAAGGSRRRPNWWNPSMTGIMTIPTRDPSRDGTSHSQKNFPKKIGDSYGELPSLRQFTIIHPKYPHIIADYSSYSTMFVVKSPMFIWHLYGSTTMFLGSQWLPCWYGSVRCLIVNWLFTALILSFSGWAARISCMMSMLRFPMSSNLAMVAAFLKDGDRFSIDFQKDTKIKDINLGEQNQQKK